MHYRSWHAQQCNQQPNLVTNDDLNLHIKAPGATLKSQYPQNQQIVPKAQASHDQQSFASADPRASGILQNTRARSNSFNNTLHSSTNTKSIAKQACCASSSGNTSSPKRCLRRDPIVLCSCPTSSDKKCVPTSQKLCFRPFTSCVFQRI